MFKNYLRIAFRNIFKRKGYSFLNIAGLAIGMSCCLLIFHYVSYEKSYDQFEPDAKQVVRVRLDSYQKGVLAYKSATSYPAIAPTMKRDFPEVDQFCRLIDDELLLSNEAQDKKFSENKGYYADPATIDMFGLHFIRGNPNTALNGPDKIILSESTAKKYFGNGEALGKTLINRNGSHVQPFEVTGIYKDFPANSHLIMNYLVSYATLGQELRIMGDSSNASETAWGWYDFYVYLQLKPGIDYKSLEAKLPAFTDKYINSQGWNKDNNRRVELHLIPLSDIHLYSNYNQEAEVNGNGQAVSFLFLIAIFIICIAWINYINLATARSVERAKEVGVRKVLGALRSTLIRQFLTESFLLNVISLGISLILFFILLHPFDTFTGRATYTGIMLTSNYWLLFFILFFGGTFLSGLYPAFVLSHFKPISVLKGAFKNTTGGLLLRKSLIVVQFVTSVVLIAGTIIVYRQINYMTNQSIGADINQTLVLKGTQTIADSLYQNVYQPFKTAVLQQPGIKSIAASSSVMGDEVYWTNSWKRDGDAQSTAVTLYNLGIDYDFIPSYKMELASGRNFSNQFGTDKKTVIFNENAVKLLGFKSAADAVNQKVIVGGDDTLTIIGVTKNFHQLGLQKNIDPMVLRLTPNISTFYSIKWNGANSQQTIATLRKLWNEYFPKDPFNYFFLDESFGQQYKADMLFGKVFGSFAFLAILIACFGLLGLSAYNVLQRTKEIGIRKVLGASVQSIMVLLSQDFLKLVLISLLLAVPIGWYVMNNWLQDYAYRINISWWIFLTAGLLSLFIALLTIGFQVLKAAVDNPVKSLRTE
ncbi:FtsX-like permease family protein [Ilyomonas limi]|uniref:FtsX-like permease family protein n=1 Tax=Ilyomonas limi TaxID=2575867 RepID=A0A4U3KZN2_9BACT|nr:ABC transporter permease [Ilyomonas limi]TKK68261.1 FtsX-like permease family protein [Ilyomonas limi]